MLYCRCSRGQSFYLAVVALSRRLRWKLAQGLEWRWWNRYLAGKSPEDYLLNKRAYWKRTLAELEWEVAEGATALDAGCGPAGIYLLLHATQTITAIDPLLDHYRRLAVFRPETYPEVRFLRRTMEELEPLSSFRQIYCFNAINHVRDWERALDALAAVASPGTEMILTSDVHRHAWLLPVFRLLPGDVLHPQQHGPDAYRRALTARGWRIDRERLLRREAIFEYRAWVCTFTPAGTVRQGR